MGSLREWISRVRDGRKVNSPVDKDRRRPTRQEARERLDRAHERLQEKLRKLTGESKFIASNDIQQVVIFASYRDEVCKLDIQVGEHRLCRHPKHPAANTGIAKCDGSICPALALAIRGAA